MRRRLLALLAAGTVAGVALVGAGTSSGASGTVALSALDGSTQPTSFVLHVDTPGATSAKLVLDGTYVGEDTSVPLDFTVTVPAGVHKVKVRPVVSGTEGRVDASFTATGAPSPTSSPTPTASPTPSASPSPTGSPTMGTVHTVAELRAALATAHPGDTITVADGTYEGRPRFLASASGTPTAPITLRGSRAAILRSTDTGGDYGLSITGSYWHVQGLTVAHASKGIVLDGSVGTVLDSVEVYDIGAEGVHFRACSSDDVLRNSYVHDTGVDKAQYGEGVYVGSANSNWASYSCTDGRDNSERALVENNVFRHVAAEGADLKEGTDSGTLRGNLFDDTGYSGENSADSAVDAKGNGWTISGNTVTGATGAFLDAFQTHSVYSGYGTGNTFTGNTVQGPIPGFGVGLYPALGNTVRCDNTAPQAAQGLVGANGKPATCTP